MNIIINRYGKPQSQFKQFASESNAYNVLRKALLEGHASGCQIHFIPVSDNRNN